MTDALALTYDCDRQALGPVLGPRFVPLARDPELTAFLEGPGKRPHGYLATKLMAMVASFTSSYDMHGLFGAYQMHLLSSRAWGELLGERVHESLLDVGAGAGYVTEGARPYFRELVCTETAERLRRRLAQRQLPTLAIDLTSSSLGRTFSVVSCFNVLDRTARPLTLLRSLVEHVQPGGLLLLSMPLPAAPHVHVEGGTIAASERLPSIAADWESAARELSERMIMPLPLSIERLSRVPYLSRGDAYAPLYLLDAALWVCRRVSG
jgi:SAM-dependent methyltransferase